jgi:hypothetical protein
MDELERAKGIITRRGLSLTIGVNVADAVLSASGDSVYALHYDAHGCMTTTI